MCRKAGTEHKCPVTGQESTAEILEIQQNAAPRDTHYDTLGTDVNSR